MRPEAELDIECFHNWFLVGITDSATGIEWDFQMVPGNPLDVASIEALLRHYTTGGRGLISHTVNLMCMPAITIVIL